MSSYEFIDALKAEFPIRVLCRVVEVPESSYFDWDSCGRARHVERGVAKASLIDAIVVAHDVSDGTYGSPKIHGQLRRDGRVVSLRRVAETMSDAGIAGISGREHSTVTTRRDRLEAPFPDLVNRRFLPLVPDSVWYGDITYIWVKDRFWYMATVIDAATKELVGWTFADHMRAEPVSDALHAAVRRRGGRIPPGVIFHSDRGSQYTSAEFGIVCGLYKVQRSMGRRGVCFDNAGAESFFSTIKRELVDRYFWDDPKNLRLAIYTWVETWYNRRRLHASLGMRTPAEVYADHLVNHRVG